MLDLTQKSVIFFDMDGLLLDTENLYYETRRQILNKYGYSYTQKHHARYIGKGFTDTICRLKKFVGDEKLGKQVFTESMELFQTAIENEKLPLKQGALQLLTMLNEKGKSCYLTSSSSKEIIMQALQKTQIEGSFDKIISGEEVNRNKPMPDIYLRAVEIAQTNKRKALVFEDSKSGVEAAFQADIDVIMVPDWLPPSKQEMDEVTAVLPNLEEALVFFTERNNRRKPNDHFDYHEPFC